MIYCLMTPPLSVLCPKRTSFPLKYPINIMFSLLSITLCKQPILSFTVIFLPLSLHACVKGRTKATAVALFLPPYIEICMFVWVLAQLVTHYLGAVIAKASNCIETWLKLSKAHSHFSTNLTWCSDFETNVAVRATPRHPRLSPLPVTKQLDTLLELRLLHGHSNLPAGIA